MTSYRRADAAFDQVIAQIPPESKNTLTTAQLNALKLAFRQVNWKSNPAINIRLSIPICKSGFYVVFLAGRERRAQPRRRAEMPHYQRQAIAGLVILTLSLGSAAALSYAALSLMFQASQRDNIHPTAIPWLKTQSACEQTGRTWESNQCWDQGHSPDF
ncbi:MAG TPA: hypothetical protein V6C57_26525 [Coleofasciculaceae cyanobacterium]